MSSGSNPYSAGAGAQFPDQGGQFQPPGTPLPNYLVQSILVTLCCCFPFGIVAIIYAARVNRKIARGDHAGAKASSDNAKKWCWIGVIFGVIIEIVVIGIQILVGVAAVQQQNANGMGGF